MGLVERPALRWETRSASWRTVALILLLVACAVTPCVFVADLQDVFYLPKVVALWALLAAVSLFALVSIANDEPGPRFRWIGIVDAPLAALVLLVLAALGMSTDKRQSLFGETLQHQGVLTMLLYVGFFYVARWLIRDTSRILLLFVAVAIGATTVSAYAIVQKLGLDPIWNGELPSGRVFSTIGQPNALAAYLVLALPVTAALALTGSKFLRLAALAGLAAMTCTLLLTYSRGGYLGFAVAAAVFVYGARDRIKVRRAVACLFASVAIIVIVLVGALVAPARSAITEMYKALRISDPSSNESVAYHLDLWKVAIRVIASHPVVGTGPETFPDQFPRYSPSVLPTARVSHFEQFRVESPHNQLLAVASGAGIPAAVAYLGVLVGITRTVWRRVSSSVEPARRLAFVAIVAAGAGHVVTDSFMTAEVTGSWLFWTLAGAGVGTAIASTHTERAGRALPDGDAVAADVTPLPSP